MDSLNEISGSLKQQCLDGSGLYEWVRKTFKLKVLEGLLDIYLFADDHEPQSQLSLYGARHAKEWSISSAIAGYGFDIVWASGKMWSFLADNEGACHNWVINVNKSIRICVSKLNKGVDLAINKSGEDFRRILGIPKVVDEVNIENQYDNVMTGHTQGIDIYQKLSSQYPNDESQQRYGSAVNENDITTEFQSPLRGLKQSYYIDGDAPTTAPRYSGIGDRYQSSGSRNRGKLNISDIPLIDSASDRSSPEALSPSEEEKEGIQRGKSTLESKRIRFIGGGQGVESVRVQNKNPEMPENLEISALRLRCHQLVKASEGDRAESDRLRAQLLLVQDELHESLFTVERNAHAMRQKEREHYQTVQADTHSKIVRAVDERDILHEANMRAAQEQNSREMACLREELMEARRRFGDELSKESGLRDATEGREMELRRENASLRDANSRLTADRLRVTESSQMDAATWRKEREDIIAAADARIASLEDESEALIARGQSELKAKINELTMKFDAIAIDTEKNMREALMQEMATEKIKEISVLLKKVARTDERRQASKEVDSVKKYFLEREEQTSEDLSELEKLHAGRIARLEQQLATSRKREAAAQDSLDVAVREMDKGAEGSKSTTGKYFRQLEESARSADGLAEELESAHSELQESRVRESVYREQLARVLEDARVKNAMLLEAQRQASEGSAQAYQWRKAVAVIDGNQSATTTHLQISRDEIAMLEHDLKRLKGENNGLKTALEKAERLIYGPIQHLHMSQDNGAGGGIVSGKSTKSKGVQSSSTSVSTGNNSISLRSKSPMASRSSSTSHSSGGEGGSEYGHNHSYSNGHIHVGSKASHPPWRSGMCNCSCRASWCRCLGHGASVTS